MNQGSQSHRVLITVVQGWLLPVILGLTSPSLIAESRLPATDQEAIITADSYELNRATGWAVGQGAVSIEYGPFNLQAENARYNLQTGEIEAHTNVQLFYDHDDATAPGFVWQTEHLQGNLHTGELHSSQYKLRHGSIFLSGPGAERDPEGNLILDAAKISTCEHLLDEDRTSHFHIHAGRLRYSPQTERFKLANGWIKIANLPVFYLPFFFWDRNWQVEDFSIRAGHNSDWGSFIMLGRRWRLSPQLTTRLELEARSNRGLALASTTTRKTGNSETELSLYGLRDSRPPTTEPGFNRRFALEKNRYRLQFYHFHRLAEDWDLRLQIDRLSDIDMLEEWFESEFRRNPQPRSYADLRYQGENFTFSSLLRPRINRFYTVVERMPELRFEIPRQPLSDSSFLYQGESELARLNLRWRQFDRPLIADISQDPADYKAWRLDSLHLLYRPLDLGDQLQLTPRAGIRLTYYSQTSASPITTDNLARLFQADDPFAHPIDPEEVEEGDYEPLQNYDSAGGSTTRLAAELGLELSRKYEKTWSRGMIPGVAEDGVRLITRPYTNYTFIPEPTADRDHLYYFDQTDRMIRQNFIRLGLEQRLQTRQSHGRGIDTVARMSSYADFHLEAPDGQGNLGNLASKLEFTPPGSLALDSIMIFDLHNSRFNYLRTQATLHNLLNSQATLSLAHSYSHNYRSGEINAMGSSLLDFRGESLSALRFSPTHEVTGKLGFPLGEKTNGAIGYGYDFNQGSDSHHQLELSRDFHCWTGTLGYQRTGSGANAKTEVYFMFHLNAFPGAGFGYGI